MKRRLIGAATVLGLITASIFLAVYSPKSEILLSNARAEIDVSNEGTLSVYLNLSNGNLPDTLVGASSEVADDVALITVSGHDTVPIPADSNPVLSADGAFVKLSGFDGAYSEGQLIPITLQFEEAGEMATKALVSPPSDPHAAHRAMMGNAMSTELIEEGQAPPQAEIVITRNGQGGWDVQLETDNFAFDDQSAEPVHVPGHGHGHLYINGLKLQRMYGPTATIGQLPKGLFDVTVSLNTNDHRPYFSNDAPVEAKSLIEVN